MTIDTVLCDYGGVVADHYSEPYESQLAELLGVGRQRLRSLLSERSPHGRAYRLDQLTMKEFWSEVIQGAGKVDPGTSIELLQELWARTYIPNQAVLSLLSYLRFGKGLQ